MSEIAKIVSINISGGDTIQIGQAAVPTGIFKRSVSGPVAVGTLGLEGDHIADLKHHGGAGQAVYLYSMEDYAWWSAELGREVPAGTFGENLTLSSYGGNGGPTHEDFRPGDRFQIGDVLLELTFGRIPCSKLGAVMGDQRFVKRFVQAQRPGIYVRVLQTGTVATGDTVTYIPTEADYPRMLDLYNLFYTREPDPALIRRAIEAPIDERGKGYFQEMLEKTMNDE